MYTTKQIYEFTVCLASQRHGLITWPCLPCCLDPGTSIKLNKTHFCHLHDKAAKTLSWGHPESCSQAQRSHRITDDVKMCHQCVSDNYYGFSLRSFLAGQFFLTLWLSLATNLKHLSYIFLKRDLGDWEVHITSLDLCYTANSFPGLPLSLIHISEPTRPY